MKPSSLFTSATQLARDIRAKVISPVEVLEHAIAAIERHNPRLLAFCTLTLEQARMDAREMERKLGAGEAAGALAGIPLGIKDLILTRGTRTTGGCIEYA